MALEIINLTRPAFLNNNIGGVQQDILIAPVNLFLALQQPPTSHTNPGDSAKIIGNHTFSGTDGFIKLAGDHKLNNFEGDFVGDFGSNNMEYKINAFFHGLTAIAEEVSSLFTNNDLILLVRNLKPGAADEVFQFGTGTMPVHLASKKTTSGTPSDGRKGYEFQFIARQPMIYYYSGTITLAT
jgi:hypothetical protein